MIETELKISLDAGGRSAAAAAPRARRRCGGRRAGRRGWSRSTSTPRTRRWPRPGSRCVCAGSGGAGCRPSSAAATGDGGDGLFAHVETERPAPGGRLALTGRSGRASTRRSPRRPATRRWRRCSRPGCGASSSGWRARRRRSGPGDRSRRNRRGRARARRSWRPSWSWSRAMSARSMPWRGGFSRGSGALRPANKAARGYRLARTGRRTRPRWPAQAPGHSPMTPRRRSRRWPAMCCATVWRRSPLTWWWWPTARTIEGPHQLRVGLRRLRTALAVFAPEPRRGGAGAARRGGAAAGAGGRRLARPRRADRGGGRAAAAAGSTRRPRDALTAALRGAARGQARRGPRRAGSAGRRRLPLRSRAFIEARGWLAPADYSQTARLAAPIGEVAPAILAKRHRKAKKRGRGIETSTTRGCMRCARN